jgi:tRNA threonylcarbamoyladenosine biosynthesis protein TsaB
MAIILSIETSEKICSVALSKDYELISTLEINEEKSHASKLTVLVTKLLYEKEIDIKRLDAVAVSKGPGSYTGLRIGVSVAKGICYALNIPLIAINTLQILTLGLINSGGLRKTNITGENIILCPLIDARRMEVYRAFFNMNGDQISEITAEIIHKDSFCEELKSNYIIFFGSGADKCKNVILNPNAIFIDEIKPNASYMVIFASDFFIQKKFENYAYFEPLYLKDFVTTVPKK